MSFYFFTHTASLLSAIVPIAAVDIKTEAKTNRLVLGADSDTCDMCISVRKWLIFQGGLRGMPNPATILQLKA